MRLQPEEILIGFMPSGELETLDWRQTVTEVAQGDTDRPDHLVAVVPMTGRGRNLDDAFDAEVEDARRDMADAARHEAVESKLLEIDRRGGM